jgi:hypothetical protein
MHQSANAKKARLNDGEQEEEKNKIKEKQIT